MAPPTLLLTRPLASARAFAATLDPAALVGVTVLIAPLMEISATGNTPDLKGVEGVIFTSVNGVLHAPDGAGRRAYCVGVQTTRKAVDRGWDAMQAGDTAQELIATLQSNPPAAPLLHLAGVHTRGDIGLTLTSAGIRTDYIALYDQTLIPLEDTAEQALNGPCIIPVFSPRSAEHLVEVAGDQLGNAHVIALSNAVAAPLSREKLAQLVVIPSPQVILMRKAVENLCKTLGPP